MRIDLDLLRRIALDHERVAYTNPWWWRWDRQMKKLRCHAGYYSDEYHGESDKPYDED